jgi:cytoskeletal protein CcmA (bactofilin family)
VNGDVTIGANLVEINGLVNGDLLVGANIVTINGNVTGDVRAGCSILNINGVVGGEVLAGAGQAVINEGSSVGEINIGTGSLTIDGAVKGNVTVSADNITITDKASIDGSLNYYSEKDAVIQNLGVITGSVNKKEAPSSSDWMPAMNWGWSIGYFSILFFVIGILSELVVGLVLIKISEKSVKELKARMSKNAFDHGVKGFAFLVLVPIAAVIAMITIIAIPLSLIALALYAIMLYLGSIIAAFWVGMKVFELLKIKAQPLVTELIVGIIILKLVGWIPFIGWLISFIIWLIALGALMKLSRESFDKCKKQKIC